MRHARIQRRMDDALALRLLPLGVLVPEGHALRPRFSASNERKHKLWQRHQAPRSLPVDCRKTGRG